MIYDRDFLAADDSVFLHQTMERVLGSLGRSEHTPESPEVVITVGAEIEFDFIGDTRRTPAVKKQQEVVERVMLELGIDIRLGAEKGEVVTPTQTTKLIPSYLNRGGYFIDFVDDLDHPENRQRYHELRTAPTDPLGALVRYRELICALDDAAYDAGFDLRLLSMHGSVVAGDFATGEYYSHGYDGIGRQRIGNVTSNLIALEPAAVNPDEFMIVTSDKGCSTLVFNVDGRLEYRPEVDHTESMTGQFDDAMVRLALAARVAEERDNGFELSYLYKPYPSSVLWRSDWQGFLLSNAGVCVDNDNTIILPPNPTLTGHDMETLSAQLISLQAPEDLIELMVDANEYPKGLIESIASDAVVRIEDRGMIYGVNPATPQLLVYDTFYGTANIPVGTRQDVITFLGLE